jgi:aspartate racemase
MKTIGIIGGLSWPSTIVYYESINQEIYKLSEGKHTGSIIIDSWDFPPAKEMMPKEDWDSLNQALIRSVQRLILAGSQVIALACNTLHRCIPAIPAKNQNIIIHILEPVCSEIKKRGIQHPLLLSTKFTADSALYKNYIGQKTSAQLTTPDQKSLEIIHRIIFEYLVCGTLNEKQRKEFHVAICNSLKPKTDGILLGCTELCLALKHDDFGIPVIDTTTIHARAIANCALEESLT